MSNLLNCTKLIVISFIATVIFIMTPTSAFAIVGGEEAVAGQQNWMVAITLADESNGYYAQFCGGTLIDSEWVLTAAHCTIDENNVPFAANDLDVIIGRTKLSSQNGQRISVAQIVRHPSFDLSTYNNDIALFRLSSPVTGEFVRLADAKTTADAATVFGWGMTESGFATDTLKKAELALVTRNECQNAYTDYGINISNNMVCAGFAQGGIDSCVGDSGGPLVSEVNGQAVQVGLVSWGLECGAAGLYGVYTNVAQYNTWIAFQMNFNN